MEFNSQGTLFTKKSLFSEKIIQFVSKEAETSSAEKEDTAAASMDRTAEKIIRLSAIRNKLNATRVKDTEEATDSETAVNSKHEFRGSSVIDTSISEKIIEFPFKNQNPGESKFVESKNDNTSRRQNARNTGDSLSEKSKTSRSTEIRKAAAKTAVANLLKAKADMANDLVEGNITGDALKDGNSGLVKTFTTAINPMTYLKKYLAKIAAIIAPYVLIFITIAAVFFILVSVIFSVLDPFDEIGESLSTFIATFSGNDGGLRNAPFTGSEIDNIIEDSEAEGKQETVLRYALSKVGYAYSQGLRTSGRAYDCSSLAYYAWMAAGVDISYGDGYPPTAADEAKMLKNHGKKTLPLDLQPGDLVFYGGKPNDRYLGIYHVAIYVGNGMAVEALNTKYGVVYQKLRTDNTCMVCRPYM